MLTLKIPDWKDIVPFAFYLNPVEKSIKELRELVQSMKDKGPLHIKYVLEENEELQNKCIQMVNNDYIAQWLLGDELKQDQFRFFYDAANVIYESAAKSKLLE